MLYRPFKILFKIILTKIFLIIPSIYDVFIRKKNISDLRKEEFIYTINNRRILKKTLAINLKICYNIKGLPNAKLRCKFIF